MLIGLISDTHGYLDPKVYDHFANCDEIWHAGDLGENVAEPLEKFKPFRCVYGNIDTKEMQVRYPEDAWFDCEGLTVWITHIGGAPPSYNPRVKKILREKVPHIFICGHSHILRVKRDPSFKNMLYINPGAAGNQGFHKMKTLIRLEIVRGDIRKMEAIELGLRGALP